MHKTLICVEIVSTEICWEDGLGVIVKIKKMTSQISGGIVFNFRIIFQNQKKINNTKFINVV